MGTRLRSSVAHAACVKLVPLDTRLAASTGPGSKVPSLSDPLAANSRTPHGITQGVGGAGTHRGHDVVGRRVDETAPHPNAGLAYAGRGTSSHPGPLQGDGNEEAHRNAPGRDRRIGDPRRAGRRGEAGLLSHMRPRDGRADDRDVDQRDE
jgi:hypothetical protein